MKRYVGIVSALLLLLFITAAAPAQVNIPLLVEEHNNLARTGEILSSGVPFALGTLYDVDLANLRVEDASGAAVPAQFQVLSRWWSPRYDNSIRWLLVTFPATAGANATTTYTLKTGSNVAPAKPVSVTTTADLTTVDTGAIKAVINSASFNLFESVWLDADSDGQYGPAEKVVHAAASDGLVITSGDWPDLGLVAGQEFRSSAGAATTVTVEEAGPLRAVLHITGTLQREGLPVVVPYYEHAVRMYFYAGSPLVRCHVTLRNNRIASKKTWVWPIEDFTVRTSLLSASANQYALLGQTAPVRGSVAADVVRIYQDSNGTDNWLTMPGGTYEKWLCPWTNGTQVRGVTFRGYKTSDGATDGTLGCAVGIKDFWQQYPKALRAAGHCVEVGLLPTEWSEVFSLPQGSRKRHEIVYNFHSGSLTDQQMADLFTQVDRPLRFRCPASIYIDSDAWDGGLASAPAQTPSTFSKTATTGSSIGVRYGWDWYGWMSGWNSAGGHENETSMFMPYVLWGDWRRFEDAEIKTLWGELSPVMMFDQPIDMVNHWHYLYAWPNYLSTGVTELKHPAWYNRAVWGRPDTGHCGMWQQMEYYYLTGDRHTLEQVLYYGQHATWYFHPHFHLGKKYQYSNYNGNPDDPNYVYGNRYWTWPIYNLAQAYAASGNPAWLDDAWLAIKGVRNALRLSPLKFASGEVYDAGSTQGYYSNWPAATRATSASQGYALFQMAISARAAARYYQETGDEDALDVMVGYADFLVESGTTRDASGNLVGYPYCWADYWGMPAPGTGVHSDVTGTLGFIWNFVRKSAYTRDLNTIYTTGKLSASNWPLNGYFLRANLNPPADLTPPAAITDLRGRVRADGSLLVSWTAPGNNGLSGTAARYQLKYATSPLVEAVTGWPDLAVPLPMTAVEWKARAAALKANQLPFVSAWNVSGEPAPAMAGTIQSMAVPGLTAGAAYHLALKSMDAVGNLSDLGNVLSLSATPSIPGDVNADNHVDVVDLLYLVDTFGTAAGDVRYDPVCDFNDDGSVDVVDLLALVETFGQ
jgi:hypothetical protein